MPTEQAKAERSRLTLIEGLAGETEFGLAPLGVENDNWGERTVERSLPRRPGDHLEAWTFHDDAALALIRRAARKRGLNADTAVTLVIERRLVLADLESAGLGGLERALDHLAAESRPSMEIWSAHSNYLRHLLRGDALERNSKLPLRSSRVALPIRLIDRLGERAVLNRAAANSAELGRAVEWEIAAVWRGELMSEWAYRSGLLTITGDVTATGGRY